MKAINPYLNFLGNTEEAFNFYRSVFGGEFLTVMRFKDTPVSANLPAEDQEKIMHIALPIAGGAILMATDVLASMGQTLNAGNNISLAITAESETEADALYKKLSEGGQATMPMEKMFWNSYFGMLTDRFGIHWMVDFPLTAQ